MADSALDLATTTATATGETPSSSPVSSASSPASSGPDIAGETAAAWQQAAAAGSPPAASRETPPPAQPATQADGLAATPDGRLPLARHQAILKEARDKADREIAELKQRFAWAERVNPQQVDQGVALVNWLMTDPASAIDFLQRQHARTQPAPVPAEPMPEPDVVLQDGSKFYSAAAAAKYADWRERQLETRFNQQVEDRFKSLSPLLQTVAVRELNTQANTEASQQLAYFRQKFPQFQALEKDIKALMLQQPDLSPEHAYILAYAEKGRAKEREAWEAERTGRLQTKGAASSIAPGTARPVTPKADRDKTTKEIVREAFLAASA